MKQTIYEKPKGTALDFLVEWGEDGKLLSLVHPEDSHRMNWVKGKQSWGTIRCGLELSVRVSREWTGQGRLRERYVFANETGQDICTCGTQLGIYTVFPDYYTNAEVCMTECCNTHIWCGGSSSYICALRMGGGGRNLGLILTKGSLKGYSVERDLEKSSNDRGDFILHPENMHLVPGESAELAWELFWFEDKEDFLRILGEYPDFVMVEAENFVLLGEEKVCFRAKAGQAQDTEEPVITRDGKRVPFVWKDGEAFVEEKPECSGELRYEISWRGKISRAAFLAHSQLWELAEKRCRFIAKKQQCGDKRSHLDGAYLIYDREEQQRYYSYRSDHNGGRERVGMGALLACFLQHRPDAFLEQSLDRYVEYVLRELFDEETGEVFNDAGRNQDWKRLYNYPWICVLFLELFRLKKDRACLRRAYRCMRAYYEEGGSRFYAIGIPMWESVSLLRENGMEEEADWLLARYREHADLIAARGKNYPAHEVKYEQSIVAPAATYLCEMYRLTGEEKYKKAALEQLEVLDLFQGFQPDHHMNEVAIRHWDGYWFGKRECYGDTFPHYWSALSGVAYRASAAVDETGRYAAKAEKTLRGVLSLFEEDGNASCACVYPMSVNGQRTGFYDPWANDQDWGLYYMLKFSGKRQEQRRK